MTAQSPAFQDHHVIEKQALLDSKLLGKLKQLGLFDIDAPENHINLPSTQELAAKMGVSPHPGGPLSSYSKNLTARLQALQSSPDGEAALAGDRAAAGRVAEKVNSLRNRMRAALINGDLFTNTPDAATGKDPKLVNDAFFNDEEGYDKKHGAQIKEIADGKVNAWDAVTKSETKVNAALDAIMQEGRKAAKGDAQKAMNGLGAAVAEARESGRLVSSAGLTARLGSIFGRGLKGLGIAGLALDVLTSTAEAGELAKAGDTSGAAGTMAGLAARLAFGWAGGEAGATGGAAVGLVLAGPVGAAIGGIVGGILGGIGGALGGEALVEALGEAKEKLTGIVDDLLGSEEKKNPGFDPEKAMADVRQAVQAGQSTDFSHEEKFNGKGELVSDTRYAANGNRTTVTLHDRDNKGKWSSIVQTFDPATDKKTGQINHNDDGGQYQYASNANEVTIASAEFDKNGKKIVQTILDPDNTEPWSHVVQIIGPNGKATKSTYYNDDGSRTEIKSDPATGKAAARKDFNAAGKVTYDSDADMKAAAAAQAEADRLAAAQKKAAADAAAAANDAAWKMTVAEAADAAAKKQEADIKATLTVKDGEVIEGNGTISGHLVVGPGGVVSPGSMKNAPVPKTPTIRKMTTAESAEIARLKQRAGVALTTSERAAIASQKAQKAAAEALAQANKGKTLSDSKKKAVLKAALDRITGDATDRARADKAKADVSAQAAQVAAAKAQRDKAAADRSTAEASSKAADAATQAAASARAAQEKAKTAAASREAANKAKAEAADKASADAATREAAQKAATAAGGKAEADAKAAREAADKAAQDKATSDAAAQESKKQEAVNAGIKAAADRIAEDAAKKAATDKAVADKSDKAAVEKQEAARTFTVDVVENPKAPAPDIARDFVNLFGTLATLVPAAMIATFSTSTAGPEHDRSPHRGNFTSDPTSDHRGKNADDHNIAGGRLGGSTRGGGIGSDYAADKSGHRSGGSTGTKSGGKASGPGGPAGGRSGPVGRNHGGSTFGGGIGSDHAADKSGHRSGGSTGTKSGGKASGPGGPAGGRSGPVGRNPGSTPVLLDMNGDGHIDLRPLSSDAEAAKDGPCYDWNSDGKRDATAWVGPDDAVLVIDLAADGTSEPDGRIDQPEEIAFSLWKTEEERQAELKVKGIDDTGQPITDLEGLRHAFDTNKDNILDASDVRWNEFRVWQDMNQNGTTDPGELQTISEAGIKLFNLLPSNEGSKLFADGSAITGTSTAQKTDGTIMLTADATLAYRPF